MKQTPDRIHLRAYGGVQGVGFRFFVRDAARRLRLAGWVRNLSDGSVEVEAAGEAAGLEQLRRTVQHGPALAHVERVAELEPGDEALPEPFEIRRSGK